MVEIDNADNNLKVVFLTRFCRVSIPAQNLSDCIVITLFVMGVFAVLSLLVKLILYLLF